jgi:hypothetical protein
MKYLASLSAIFTGLAIFLIPTKMANGCGAGDYGYYVYSFIEPDIIEEPSYRPFFFTFMSFFDDWQGETFSKEENLGEWHEYFFKKVPKEAIDDVIYKSNIAELKQVLKGTIPDSIKSNALLQHLIKNPNKEFVNYLIFAKTCEPYATNREFDWDGNLIVEDTYTANAGKLAKEGLAAFNASQNEFLQSRYAFQAVRLARYSQQWEETIRAYETIMTKLRIKNNFIYYWTMEHYAGALYNSGQKAKAAYHFAQIFDKCPSRRLAAYKSFGVSTDDEWQEALSYCKNNEEKAALFALRAVNPINNAAEEMQSIYGLNPKSKQLNFLLIREIQKLEYELLGASYNKARQNIQHYSYDPDTYESFVDFPREGSEEYLKQLLALTKKCTAEKKVQQPNIWKLAEGYLEFMNGNHAVATSIFNDLEKLPNSVTFKQQLLVFKAAIEVDQLEKIDAETEKKIPEYLKLLKNAGPEGESGVSPTANYTRDKLAYLYHKQGQTTKAFLCKNLGFYDLLVRPSMVVIDDLLTMHDKLRNGNLSEYEEMLSKDIFYKSEYQYNENTGEYATTYTGLDDEIKDQLIEIKGTIYLGLNDLDKAIATFEKLPAAYHNENRSPEYWVENPTQRFNINNFQPFNLYIGAEVKKNADPTFNKLKLAKQLKELENNIKNGTGNLGDFYYKLGLVHYNMSNSGKGWRAIDYWWTAYPGEVEISENVYGYDEEEWGNQDFLYHDNALSYLTKAIGLLKSSNPELAAKANFLAGMCVTKKSANEEAAEGTNPYWTTLKASYKNTKFCKQLIKECPSFEFY